MSKSIVVYYTWSGTTKGMADIIAELTGADILEITPETPYSRNYNEVANQGKKETQTGTLPPIKHSDVDFSKYDVVFIGTPIWWYTMAPPVATFINENDLSGKIIMPFSTHGGGGKYNSDKDIVKLCPNSEVMEMYTAYEGGGSSAKKEITNWINKNIK